jgi:histidinol-phosphatase
VVTPPARGYADDVGLAHVLADAADEVTRARFRAADLSVATKTDGTPVTDADTDVEQVLRGILGRARPRDAVLGEEFAYHAGSAAATRQWVLDPIDGTANFARGVPVWATLIALLDDDEPVVGMVSAPALGRRWWAAHGTGAFAGKHQRAASPIRVSGVEKLSQASLSYASLHSWRELGRMDGFLRLTAAAERARGYGDFLGHVLVADGSLEATVEASLALWDMAALACIVTEAGGRFSDLEGVDGPFGASGVSSNGLLHEAVLEQLRPDTPPIAA